MKPLFTLLLTLFTLAASGADFQMKRGQTVVVQLPSEAEPVVRTAFSIVQGDAAQVLGATLVTADGQSAVSGKKQRTASEKKQRPSIIVSLRSDLKGPEHFLLEVNRKGQLLISASDSHGAAYGLLELSRLMGVSPWEWWADATPLPRDEFLLPQTFRSEQQPSVRFRGIFINDEDWGLMPWSSQTVEPGQPRGVVGPETTRRIFTLLLRLRANTYWPPMHECTHPFFLTEGNRLVARDFGIYIGGSHCEPMVCTTPTEWPLRGKGDYNYLTNRANVRDFWQKRLNVVANQDILYTIGMRGLHDGRMQGAKTVKEQLALTQQAIDDQRAMLDSAAKATGRTMPQIFVPYKEVLTIYNAGLRVPDDVTLVWTDDNFGYIRQFPTPAEQSRQGGNGIYYHTSYWGLPQDYLWIGTVHPALLLQQMSAAYAHGIRQLWMLNVGDIKPAEYQIELFMDLAWDFQQTQQMGLQQHRARFLQRELGSALSESEVAQVGDILAQAAWLNYIHLPEFMAGTRVYEKDRQLWQTPRFIAHEALQPEQRMRRWEQLSQDVESLWQRVQPHRRDCFFQLVKYPVQAAAEMNRKFLAFYLLPPDSARAMSHAAYDSIAALTATYNRGFANGGKWQGIMDFQPRKLSVFSRIDSLAAPLDRPTDWQNSTRQPVAFQTNADEGATVCPELGYSQRAVQLSKGQRLHCDIQLSNAADAKSSNASGTDTLCVALHFVPTMPTDGDSLAVRISLDGKPLRDLRYDVPEHSEAWKQGVLWNRRTCLLRLPCNSDNQQHRLTLEALTNGVVVDEVCGAQSAINN